MVSRNLVSRLVVLANMCLFVLGLAFPLRGEQPPILVGFAEEDITPNVKNAESPVWMAGYGEGREATSVRRIFQQHHNATFNAETFTSDFDKFL